MIRVAGVSRRFNNRAVVEGIDLGIRKGEIFTLIGPSGSGKTTLLRLIDLLDRPTAGSITLDGNETGGSERERRALRRRMAMVFQKPAMLNVTVEENASFGLKFRGITGQDARERTAVALARAGLSGFGGRRAINLSGGEMQRVAIARAIVTEPEILLLDEPTANLDPVSTGIIEDLIVSLNREQGTTIVIATHDMVQGQRLAHRMGVLMNGRLVQAGDLNDIFYRPVSRAVASFVGIEPVSGGVVTDNDAGLATIGAGSIKIQAVTSLPAGSRVALCIRPEEVALSLPGPCPVTTSVRNCLPGTVTDCMPYGPFTRVRLDCGIPLTALLTRRSSEELSLAPGASVMATVKATAVHVIADQQDQGV